MEMINLAAEVLIGTLIVLGSLIGLISVLGLIRFPDVYLRSHAATKSATLGVLLILAGVFLYFMLYLDHISAKLLLGIVFVFLTSPVAGHLNGRAAHRSGVALWNRSVRDDLRKSLHQKRD
ncbi:multisubunit sodium/proton antiporter MrpG subunit [Cohnella sp. SGD-V74]|uniref:monovalent cation/H(+) antiporter subunit G n=1 Tax=unclassified Cohnella TaxID=2636738 RepID=UPI000B8C6282|nr:MULTISPECIES: monovalent cation/H(+) antiporter subunit G [unclassified Cohnella]PRX69814.1 multisubunit sodium/proton antiporter MrpG subunit [Cohnella sp. SGD-V74]